MHAKIKINFKLVKSLQVESEKDTIAIPICILLYCVILVFMYVPVTYNAYICTVHWCDGAKVLSN